jgi:glucokinase-like ROK family protein
MKFPRNTVHLRQVNYQMALRTIYLNGPMSRLDLSELSELSPSTVTNLTSEMFDDGVLIEMGTEESLGGRPRTIIDINPGYGYLVGVDLGETLVQLELFDLKRRKLATARQPVSAADNSPEAYTRIISQNIQKLISDSGTRREEILGVGVGVPGVTEHNGQVNVAAPMWNWQAIPLQEMLETELELPVYIDNGAKAMALAESWFGAERGIKDMVVILLGNGIGAGVITKGHLYRGSTNSAGEWGHTKIVLDGRACRCGSEGCLEAYVGAPGILETYGDLSRMSPGLNVQDPLVNLSEIVRAYRLNDPLACQTLEKTAQMLGAGIANLVNLFNPEKIVIGGWAGLMIGEVVLDEIKGYVKKYSLPLSASKLQIGLCQFGEDAICIGAACLVLEEFLSLNEKFIR